MAKARPGDEPTPEDSVPDPRWRRLTWDDLEDWAGERSVSRGRTYQGQGRVTDLAVSGDGRLLATVTGGERYSVCVWLEDEDGGGDDVFLQSACTCPVGADGCKHAVAVVAEYLDRLSRDADVPLADADDRRWAELESEGEDIDDDDEEEVGASAGSVESRSHAHKRGHLDEKTRRYIHAMGREELAELVCSLAERFPELRDEFRERIALGEGDVDRLIAQARKELNQVTAQEAWRNKWTGEGNTPDYGKLRGRLERLVELGHADSVVQLGRELIERGMEQVGTSDDEGETATELSRCLPVVFGAVAKSSLTPVRKLLFAIDACLRDDYDVLGDAVEIVLSAEYARADWSAVADDLSRRLSDEGPKRRGKSGGGDEDDDEGDEFLRNYDRDQLSNWLAEALGHAGRGDEVLAVYEAEAKRTGSYDRLVRLLIERGRDDDARR